MLDSHLISFRNKSIWILVERDTNDILASLDVYTRDIWYRSSESAEPTIRSAAYISALFVPEHLRRRGYARTLLRHVISTLRKESLRLAVVYGASHPNLEVMCAWDVLLS